MNLDEMFEEVGGIFCGLCSIRDSLVQRKLVPKGPQLSEANFLQPLACDQPW